MRRATAFVLLFASFGCHEATRPEAAAKAPAALTAAEEPPALQLPRDVVPSRYQLTLEVDPGQAGFRGTADIQVQLAQQRSAIWLHGRGLKVTAASVEAGGETHDAGWEQVNDDGLARLSLHQPIGPGKATLHLAWEAAWDDKLTGLYLAEEAGLKYASTQFEPDLARRAFPCFDDPSFKTPFEVTLVVPKELVAVSNTPPADEALTDKGQKKIRFQPTRPLPSYLVVVAVGPFDVVTPPPLPPNEVRHHPLRVRGLAPKGRGAELAYALQAGGELLVVLEQYFGSEFPYPKLDHLAIPDFRSGAMENAGGITYREQALLFKPGVTSDEAKVRIGSIMAHEMAHQWFGDSVTLPWWTDTWLNEAFATWMAARAMRTWNPKLGSDAQALKGVQGAMGNDELLAARSIRQPLEKMADVGNQFDAITYQKGAGVIGMFEKWIGEDAFRAGIRQYLTAHADGTGSTDELLAALSAASGKDVATPFRTFLDQPGVPQVESRLVCDSGACNLLLRQSRYLPVGSQGDAAAQLWQIPVCVRLEEGSVKEKCTLLTTREGELPLGAQRPAWIAPNAGAAGYYRWSLDPAQLRELARLGYSKLSLRERLSLADALRAGVRGGTIQEADALALFAPMAADQDPEVAGEPMGPLRFAAEWLLPAEEQAAARAYAASLYKPLAAKLGWAPSPGEDVKQQRLRAQVLEFLVHVARDPETRAEAKRRGLALLAGGVLHPDAVAPDLAGLALSVAVAEDAGQLFGMVERLIPTVADGTVRGRLLAALGAARSSNLLQRGLHYSLEPGLRANERALPIMEALGEPETREAAWTWIREHHDELAQKSTERVPGFLAQRIGGAFCDEEHRAGLQQFFGPRASKVPGLPRALKQANERMKICIAQRQALSSSARAFFAKGGADDGKAALQ